MMMPEEVIIKQGETDPHACIFIIIQGDCDIQMVCHDSEVNYGDNLVKGEHFGEISVIYDCVRSADVICKSYNIMG